MPYVMVPVPEEHVSDVMQYVLSKVRRASLQPWDEESVREFFAEADEPTRSLLSFVSRAVLMNRSLTDVAAAEAIQLSMRETATVMRDANEKSRDMNRSSILLLQGTTETLPNGRTVDQRLFVMPEELARLVRAVERETHEQESHPLLVDER